MTPKKSFWERIGLQEWFLTKEEHEEAKTVQPPTPNSIFKYILDKFKESIQQLSFGTRVVFYHEYIISFSIQDYNELMTNKKGIFGLIVQESVKNFYNILSNYKTSGKTVEASSNKWVFRFVSHPDYGPGDKGFIGKLLPGTSQEKDDNLRVTYIPRQTGIAKTFDINADILKGFTFYSEGYYEVPYEENLVFTEKTTLPGEGTRIARLETILTEKEYAGRKVEYIMKENEVTVSGKDETGTAKNIFKIPSEWVSSPHLSIKYNEANNKFYVASFGEKTLVNEKEIPQSKTSEPKWTELPINSKLMLNGIVGINIFKS